MSHHDIATWIDYVRGVLDPAATSEMRAHLETGCELCGGTVRRLTQVVAVSRTDRALDPPAHLVQFAKAAFSIRQSSRIVSLPMMAARLVFNSLTGALVSGTRGPSEDVSRQTLYEAGDFSVHLRFEQPARAARVSLVGQIANRRTPEPPMSHVPVLLTRGRVVVARSLSNEFGEFQVEYEPQASLQLHIPVAGGRQRIRVSLTDLQGTFEDENPPATPGSRRVTKRRKTTS